MDEWYEMPKKVKEVFFVHRKSLFVGVKVFGFIIMVSLRTFR